jgi:hypothetical protein
MISPVLVVTIYIADKQQKNSLTEHLPDAAAANHAKFVYFNQPTL